ncbi:hypothetical protein [Kineosporia mesophila]|nr:hypothetical protein [Kineosporia mesophila]MCD5354525.1 hypothetical protein [Kineosporia mesophila]
MAHDRSGFRKTVVLAALLTAAGVCLDQRGWPLYFLTCLLLPVVHAAPRLSGTSVALLSGLGYWWWNRESEPGLLDLVWCLPASVAGWQIQRAPLSALLVVTAAAAAITVFALLPPLPATALALGSLLGGLSRR